LAELVAAISSLEITLTCGAGNTSASDGQRFALPRVEYRIDVGAYR
jgi:hypothetical protein